MSGPRIPLIPELLDLVLAHITDPTDLYHLLLTSPAIFALAAPRLYRSIPVSHRCNPFFATPSSSPSASSYTKARLLELVQEVRLQTHHEQAGEPAWFDNWVGDPLPNLVTVNLVDHQGSSPCLASLPISSSSSQLYANATRLYMPLDDGLDGIPYAHLLKALHNLRTLCCLTNNRVDPSNMFRAFAADKTMINLSEHFPHLTDVEIYVWDMSSNAKLRDSHLLIPYQEHGAIGLRGLMMVIEAYGSDLFYDKVGWENLAEGLLLVSFIFSLKRIRFYGLEEGLGRLDDSQTWARGFAGSKGFDHPTGDEMKASTRKGIDNGRDMEADELQLSTAFNALSITQHTAQDFYDTCWDGRQGHHTILYNELTHPSLARQGLLATLLKMVGAKGGSFLGLTDAELVWIIEHYQEGFECREDDRWGLLTPASSRGSSPSPLPQHPAGHFASLIGN
ncbi:hypothetical protein L202_01117 [Cryptococcus amylolentus CBS 6039]|uniref:Uncharacterized protein n=2 Tax=Cryptococcus amylolentus TaxID=104669 RepID=A0A1E3I4X6_9TREE|nr:hypothetical protein L202_01117 [Cryptococcus amylolentus CBS 6039]ODN82856.1 hypothetical protein L202_01117 [Cryptococcus amylolentus CBS 6039]ODO10511.1 hypothetical protein I350_01106 [Cryptococcus amylolentus CBS 6273]